MLAYAKTVNGCPGCPRQPNSFQGSLTGVLDALPPCPNEFLLTFAASSVLRPSLRGHHAYLALFRPLKVTPSR